MEAASILDVSASPAPIFIIGSFRSGTSILTWALGQHPNIFVLPETYWIASLAVGAHAALHEGRSRGESSYLAQLEQDAEDFLGHQGRCIDQFVHLGRERLRRHCQPERGEAADEPFRWFRAASDPKGRWVDGTPRNTYYAYELATLFPQARFLHIVRSPHEVARSLMRFERVGRGSYPNYSERQAYRSWRYLVQAAWDVERALGPDQVLRIYYQDLVREPEGLIRRCLEFAGEPFCADCLLPLSRRINSSQVAGEATPDERYRGRRLPRHMRRAVDLYEQLSAGESHCSAPDAEALELLHRRCEGRVQALRMGLSYYERYRRLRAGVLGRLIRLAGLSR